ncbi:MAG: hypothetical protein ACO1RT_08640 [Planctomycetaceae bacterium]
MSNELHLTSNMTRDPSSRINRTAVAILCFLHVLSFLSGCSSASAPRPAKNSEEVQARLLENRFTESKRWEALGTQFVEYQRSAGDNVIKATCCPAWTQIAVLAPEHTIHNADLITKAIREGEKTVADLLAISQLYSEENVVPIAGCVDRRESRIVAGSWSITATHYFSVTKGADQVTLAIFTLSQ